MGTRSPWVLTMSEQDDASSSSVSATRMSYAERHPAKVGAEGPDVIRIHGFVQM